MFYSLTGNIVFIDESCVAVECGGVAFKCASTLNTLKKVGQIGERVTLFTHLNVREDALDLFGFYDKRELECFKMLIGVTGVGPKAALAILSQLSPEQLALCIATGDVKTITKAQGIGAKIAQRVVLELKNKLKTSISDDESLSTIENMGVVSQAGNSGEAISALVMLGYSQSEASVAVSRLDSSLSVEELIKQGLRMLAKG